MAVGNKPKAAFTVHLGDGMADARANAHKCNLHVQKLFRAGYIPPGIANVTRARAVDRLQHARQHGICVVGNQNRQVSQRGVRGPEPGAVFLSGIYAVKLVLRKPQVRTGPRF